MDKLCFGDIDDFMLFGGGKFLLYIVEKLVKSDFQVYVFTSKRNLQEIIKGKTFGQLLKENKIIYCESDDINTDVRCLNNITEKTIGLSLGAPWIFKKDFINRFNGRLLNMHGTRLPQNRGGGGFTWQILRRNKLGYCLIHQIEQGIDRGNIVKYKEFTYPYSCKTPADFFDYYFCECEDFFSEFLAEIKDKKKFKCISQPEYLSIYWPRLNTNKQAFINWDWSLENIESFINAFDEPYAGASSFIGGKRVFLKECYADYNDGAFHPFQTGIVYRKRKNQLYLAVNQGTLLVGKVLTEGNEDITNKIKVGERFFTPVRYLEEAKLYKAVYTPHGLTDK